MTKQPLWELERFSFFIFFFFFFFFIKCLLCVSHFLSQFNDSHIVVWWTLSGGPQRAGSSRCAGSCPCFQLLHCVRRKLKIHKYFPTITFPCKQFLKLPRGCYVITNGRGKSGPWNHERERLDQRGNCCTKMELTLCLKSFHVLEAHP